MEEEEVQDDEIVETKRQNLEPTFMNYIKGKTEVNLCVAIDFTRSNGNPNQKGTPHYVNPDGSLNDYESAISWIGGVIGKYDTDQVSFSC